MTINLIKYTYKKKNQIVNVLPKVENVKMLNFNVLLLVENLIQRYYLMIYTVLFVELF